MYTHTQLEKMFEAALLKLQNDGLLRTIRHIDDRVYMGYATTDFDAIAQALVLAGLPGQVSAGNGVQWRYSKERGGTFLPASDGELLEGIFAARYIARFVVPASRLEDVWTVGGVARRLWEYISDKPDPYPKKRRPKNDADGLYISRARIEYKKPGEIGLSEDTQFEDHDPIGYHDCYPGFYDNAVLWDCKSYYGTMLSMIGDTGALSLRPRVYGTGAKAQIIKGEWHTGEQEKLKEVIKLVWDTKALRNSMVGVAMGSFKERCSYTSDGNGGVKPIVFRIGAGPFRRLGLIVVRTGQDLCHAQSAEVDSVYSTVDSVTTTTGKEPELWQKYGFTTEKRNSDCAIEVCGYGSWGVYRRGEHPSSRSYIHGTVPYYKKEREPREAVRPAIESKLYTQWL